MKISNMIEILNKMKKRHGDVDVYIQNSENHVHIPAGIIGYLEIDDDIYEDENYVVIGGCGEIIEDE